MPLSLTPWCVAESHAQLAEVFLDPSILGFDGPGVAELAIEAATSSFDPVHKRAGGCGEQTGLQAAGPAPASEAVRVA